MDRYVCIHGHFYQPPRENPWLEFVEVQDSAYAYHDWNERVTRECYGPNGAARILDGNGRIAKILNNYARMSFNFGPTLMLWLEQNARNTYERILAADRESRTRFDGHGSAIAQPYNHMIMPLANRRDKYTQAVWGIEDFKRRFHRDPEGMWLPETAVDLETLDILAELGVRFTILAQHQARRVRNLDSEGWRDVAAGEVDPTTPYVVRLPSGRTLAVFFYDGPISRAVAFEGLLGRGEDLAQRLAGGFVDTRPWPQIVNIATDGETYGHHHRGGEMALAYALDYIESKGIAKLTNYGSYLEKHPPRHEVEVNERTSWSCPHGVERWRSDCSCRTGGEPGWNQAWRSPLREAMDYLRDALTPEYERAAGDLLRDPWAARDEYVAVLLDRSPESVEAFLRERARRPVDAETRTAILQLLEMQRHLLLMYTSCGWFFNELSGIETIQVLQYAGRAIQLAENLFQKPFDAGFLRRLAAAKSNIPATGDGRAVYKSFVRAARVDLEDVGAHYAVSSLFQDYPNRVSVYCYSIEREDFETFDAGGAKLLTGRVRATSQVTSESMRLSFAVLHFGDHQINGGVRPTRGDEAYRDLVKSMSESFYRADFSEVIRLMDRHFGESTYSLRSLFRDEQRKVLDQILRSSVATAEESYRRLYRQHASLLYLLSNLNVPFPKPFASAAEIVLNSDLRSALSEEELDSDRIRKLLKDAEAFPFPLDREGLGYTIKRTLERLADRFRSAPGDLDALRKLDALLDLARSLPFEVDLWTVQNVYFSMLQTSYREIRNQAAQGPNEQGWLSRFQTLGERLGIRVE